jgi:hypothetical protein
MRPGHAKPVGVLGHVVARRPAALPAKLGYTVLLVVVGPHGLRAGAAVGAVLAEDGLSAAKNALLALVAAGAATLVSLAHRPRPG